MVLKVPKRWFSIVDDNMYLPWIGGGLTVASGLLFQDKAEAVYSGEESADPRDWNVTQWQQNTLASGIGYLGMVHSTSGYSMGLVMRRALFRTVAPLYVGHVVQDTVMNPGSDYYVAPDTPLLPGASLWQYGGDDVGSTLLTAVTDDLVDLFS
jgi:hypothetical protein